MLSTVKVHVPKVAYDILSFLHLISMNTGSGNLTTGRISPALTKFVIPLLLALLIQSLYSCIDMLMVGHFSEAEQMSGVASGGLVMITVTDFIASLAIGVTILLGNYKGANKLSSLGKCIGGSLALFSLLGLLLMVILTVFSRHIANLMQAPTEALDSTCSYLFICGAGMLFTVTYNLISAIMRGLGDSKTPLFTIFIAFLANGLLDYLFVAVWQKGASGAALATVISQGISVLLSILLLRLRKLDFTLHWADIRLTKECSNQILKLGFPIAFQDFVVSISFVTIQIVGNSINVISSAAVGIGEKMSYFLMLVPISYLQGLSAFVAQNEGAGLHHRSKAALLLGMIPSSICGIIMGLSLLLKADFFSSFFTHDAEIIAACQPYLRIYGLDCILTPSLFCFFGYFSGCGNTLFVMIQGIIGAFCMRMPFALIARYVFHSTSLFTIAMGSPLATFLQITICIIFYTMPQKHRYNDLTFQGSSNL